MLSAARPSHTRASAAARAVRGAATTGGLRIVRAFAWAFVRAFALLACLILPAQAALEGIAEGEVPHPLLAHESAVVHAADGEGGPTVRIPVPVIRAAGALEWRGKPFRLDGVVVTDPDATCGEETSAWPCGRMALTAIRRFVRTRTIVCAPVLDGSAQDPRAECTIADRDVGEWLISNGWAKTTGKAYAKAQNAAKEAERGLWSPNRPNLQARASGRGAIVGDPSEAAVLIEVDLSQQQLTLAHRGAVVASWPVSTARAGKRTPVGRFRAQWLSRHHRSSLYNNAPMPYSVFFNGDYAIHGTDAVGRLGRPASAGCVRLHPSHAAVVFDLAQREGLANTLVVIRH